MAIASNTRVLLLILLGIQTALSMCVIDEPMDRDEGVYSYTAWVWRTGGAPYRDVWDQKPPGIYAVHAAGQILAGANSILGARLLALIANVATTMLLFRIGSRLFKPAAGLAATAFSALYLGAPFIEGNQANTEPFLTLALTAALDVFTARASDGFATRLMTGGCLGAALLFKPTAIFNLVILALWPKEGTSRFQPLNILSTLAGAAAVWMPFVAYSTARGTFDDFWTQVVAYNFADAGSRLDGLPTLRLYAAQIIELGCTENLAIGFGAIAGICTVWTNTNAKLLLVAWTIATAIGSSAGGFAYPHYFISLVPPLALLAAAPFQSVGRRWAGVLATLAVVQLACHLPDYVKHADELSQIKYPGQVFSQTRSIVQTIRERVPPDQSVWILGSEAEILHQSGRRSATRYISFYPLSAPTASAHDRQLEAINDVRRGQPPCVVLVTVPSSLYQGALADTPLAQHLAAMPLIRFSDEYRAEFQLVGGFADGRLHLYCRHETP